MLIVYSLIIFLFITIIEPHIHIKLDLLWDDYYWYFNKDEINLDTEKQYYFRAINFSAMIGDL